MIDLSGAASFLPLTGAGFGVGFLVHRRWWRRTDDALAHLEFRRHPSALVAWFDNGMLITMQMEAIFFCGIGH